MPDATGYIQNERHNSVPAPGLISRAGKSVSYSAVVPYREWMESSRLMLMEDECNCGFSAGTASGSDLATLDFAERVFAPRFVLVTPPAEIVKTRSEKGSAYVDYPVNQTVITPTYRRNPEELARIRATIDVVARDPDASITSVKITGFASPEGSYANNERLAKGRSASLAGYVRGLYSFAPDIMHTDWVAENWQGLREYVATSSLPDAQDLLAIIDDTSLEPDAREWRLKSRYPDDYAYLLKNVYPGLRRSDYTVHYTVRSYVSPEEIKQVMATAPQKLSLNEIYVAANTMQPDSDEYREAFELAVRLFPDDPVANLNMAAIALGRDELHPAASYLAKAGNSPRAVSCPRCPRRQAGRHSRSSPAAPLGRRFRNSRGIRRHRAAPPHEARRIVPPARNLQTDSSLSQNRYTENTPMCNVPYSPVPA